MAASDFNIILHTPPTRFEWATEPQFREEEYAGENVFFLTMAPHTQQINSMTQVEYREAADSLAAYELNLQEQGLGAFSNEASRDNHVEGEHLHPDIPCSFAPSVLAVNCWLLNSFYYISACSAVEIVTPGDVLFLYRVWHVT